MRKAERTRIVVGYMNTEGEGSVYLEVSELLESPTLGEIREVLSRLYVEADEDLSYRILSMGYGDERVVLTRYIKVEKE